MTNFKALEEGEELFLKIEAKAPKPKDETKRTWIHLYKEDEQKAKKAKQS